MKEIMNSPILGVLLSLISFQGGCYIYSKTRIPIFNPLLLAITFIIVLLTTFHIPLASYNKGGVLISFFLTPATVILAVPLYKKLQLLRQNALPILIGIATGSIAGITSVFLLCNLLGINRKITLSLVPKSVTTPIGIEISKQINGFPSITVAAIIITGILGATIGPIVLKISGIRNRVAKGIAMGTASHAIGTTKAMELGELEGAMSSLSIGVAGLFMVLLAPILVKLFFLLIKW